MKYITKQSWGFNWQLGILQWLLKLSSLWPYYVKFRLIKFTIFLLLLLSFMGSCTMHLFHLHYNEDPSYAIFVVIYLYYYVYGLCFLYIKRFYLYEIFDMINNNWIESNDLPIFYRGIMYSYGFKIRRIVSTMFVVLGIITSACVVEPFIKSAIKKNGMPKTLRFEAWFPFAFDKTPVFQIMYSIQTLSAFQCLLMQVILDGTTVFIVFHCCGQLTILCKVVSNYKGVLKHNNTEKISVEYFQQSCSCTRCITNHYIHQEIFVKKVSDFFSTYNMLRIMMSTTNFCLMGYISVQSREKNEASNFILEGSFLLANVSSFFGCCWVGQQLLNKNEELVDAVHEISWYKYDHKCIYPMLMLLTRTKRPLRLTCGIFFTLSHELYSGWISTACSYLSVYNAMKTSSQQ